MMNDIAHRTIKNPYLRLLLMGLGMVILLLTFGVVGFRSDRAPSVMVWTYPKKFPWCKRSNIVFV